MAEKTLNQLAAMHDGHGDSMSAKIILTHQ